MDHALSDLRVGYVGNFGPEHSTENHVRRALSGLGAQVFPLQEDDPGSWEALIGLEPDRFDVVLWTRTGSLSPAHSVQEAALARCDALEVPTVGFHLDRWWGLDRERQVGSEPYFRCRLNVTADGGHDAEWLAAGVEHLWMPPAVLAAECEPGTPQRVYRSRLVFVGSWMHYHAEWPHRRELIAKLTRLYRREFRVWPRGGRGIRGQELRDLYASVQLAVGDSCLVPKRDGSPATFYWSDRVPETLGRGCLLVHPWVEGLDTEFGGMLPTWQLGDWPGMKVAIDQLLEDPAGSAERAAALRQLVLEEHTYERRMLDLMGELEQRGWL